MMQKDIENFENETSYLTTQEPYVWEVSEDIIDDMRNAWSNCNLYYNNENVAKIVEWNPRPSIVINTETITFSEKEIDIIVNVSNDVLSQIESIEINGFKFIKEN